jgi:hypothetical protein
MAGHLLLHLEHLVSVQDRSWARVRGYLYPHRFSMGAPRYCLISSIWIHSVYVMEGERRSAQELLEEANREVRRMEWLAERERAPARVVMALGAPRAQMLPPVPYPRWGIRPEEQLVRFNHRIDPMQRIPPAPVQDVTAAATLARLRQDAEVEAEDRLLVLAEAGDQCVRRGEEWNHRHGSGR